MSWFSIVVLSLMRTSDLPYQPPVDFDLPDYKALGQAFRRQVFSAPIDDTEPPQLVMPVAEALPESLIRLTLREIGMSLIKYHT